ncbi:MAG: thioredoxin domain-containing protein [Bacteroidales bacterium]|nr:thioredoxin domain-containing protein [Bacteroidales bacterium]
MQDNALYVVQQAIKSFHLKVTLTGSEDYLLSHPYYPSLLSLYDAFKSWGVEPYALKLNIQEIRDINRPFIAHLNNTGGQLAFVYSIKNNIVLYSIDKTGKRSEQLEKFALQFSGAVIIINPKRDSREKEFKVKLQNEILDLILIPLVIALILILGAFVSIIAIKPIFLTTWWILAIIKTIGLIASLLLVLHDFKVYIPLIHKLCSLSSEIDCNSIINSKASKVFGWLNWTDIGLIYFTSTLLFLLSNPDKTAISILKILSYLSVIFTFYSIYFQAFKAKKWCPFCLIVQLVLVAELIILVYQKPVISLSYYSVLSLFVLFSITSTIYMLLKSSLLKKQETNRYLLLYRQFKRDPWIFKQLLKKNGYAFINTSQNCIFFGNPNSEVTIISFLSFYCNYCSIVFKKLITLIGESDKVKFIPVFAINNAPETKKLMAHIYTLFNTKGKKDVIEFIEKWYEHAPTSGNRILKSIIANESSDLIGKLATENNELFSQLKVDITPVLYLNGYKLPPMYNVDELKYFIDEIVQLVQGDSQKVEQSVTNENSYQKSTKERR